MKKRVICVFTVLCLLLAGCGKWQKNAQLFYDAFGRLQEQPAVYVRVENYVGDDYVHLELQREWEVWRCGEDFYSENSEGSRSLCYDGGYWSGNTEASQPGAVTCWKQSAAISPVVPNWKNVDPRQYLKGQAVFDSKDGDIILEQKKDMGTTCSLDRQGSVTTFFMTEQWEIYKLIQTSVTYDGPTMDTTVKSVYKSIYYITPITAEAAQETLQEQYRSAVESVDQS